MPNQYGNTAPQNNGSWTPPPDYQDAASRGLQPTQAFERAYADAADDRDVVANETAEARQYREALQASINDRYGAAAPQADQQAGAALPSYAQHLNAAGYHPNSFAAREQQLQQGAASGAAAASQQPPVYSYAAPPSNTTGPYPTVYAHLVPAGTQNRPTPRLRHRQGETFDPSSYNAYQSGQRSQQSGGHGSGRRGGR
jgi:hypothetical protein